MNNDYLMAELQIGKYIAANVCDPPLFVFNNKNIEDHNKSKIKVSLGTHRESVTVCLFCYCMHPCLSVYKGRTGAKCNQKHLFVLQNLHSPMTESFNAVLLRILHNIKLVIDQIINCFSDH